MNPKVSVVMPHWNQSHLITNAVMSIRNQTLEDWEMWIVDDGSNQEHLKKLYEIIKGFDDKRINLLDGGTHEGLVDARNEGCRFAKASIIATQDADDLSMPDRLKKCVRLIESGWDIIYHGAISNWWDTQFNCISRSYIKAEKIAPDKLLKNQYIPGWPVFKKKVWETKPFRLETQYAYDWMMYLDWYFSGFKMYAIDYVLYEYVRQENSASIRFEREGLRQQSIEKIKEIVLREYGKTIDFSPNASVEPGSSC